MAYYIKQQKYYLKISKYGAYVAYNLVTDYNFATKFNTRSDAVNVLDEIDKLTSNPVTLNISVTDHLITRDRCTISNK